MNRWMIIGLAIVVIVAASGAIKYFIAPTRLPSPAVPGKIQGTTTYPSDGIPAQIVCAESTDGGAPICGQAPEQREPSQSPVFSIEVPPGDYYVYAQLKDAGAIGSDMAGYKAYYTQFVICGLRYDCKDHAMVVVTVSSGQTVTNIRPHDWYQ